MNCKLKSPLDPQNSSLELVEEMDVGKIISLYDNLNIDVRRFFKSKSISLIKCTKTGYRFYHPFEIVGDAEFYADLSKNRSNYYSKRWEHSIALTFLEKQNRVLEIGSGFGLFLSLLREKNIEEKGLELNPNAVLECKKKKLNVTGELIEIEASKNLEYYDAVVSFQVLEHVTDVHSFIESAVKTLKKGGKLIIGVPNNNPYLFINDKYHTLNLPPHHAGLWNESSLKSLQNLFPLKLEKLLYEPLDVSYDYFIEHQLGNASPIFLRKILSLSKRMTPRLLKFLCCKFINGRNILAVFNKV